MDDIIKGLAFPTVALLIGSILLFLSIAQRVELEKFKIHLSLRQSILQGILGLFLIAIGIFLHLQTSQVSGNVDTIALPTLTVIPSNTLPATLVTSIQPETQTPTLTLTLTPTLMSASTPTVLVTQTFTPFPVTLSVAIPQASDHDTLEFCLNSPRVNIREGPGESYRVINTVSSPPSNPVCLLFDSRMPDNSWVRISEKQSQSKYSSYSGGWISSTLLRPNDFESLKIFVPNSVQEGLYCVNTRNGVTVRVCPSQGCYGIGILSYQDCLYIDARTEDSLWVRISEKQNSEKFLPLRSGWVSKYFLSPSEFSSLYESFSTYYFELLPIATPKPTPDG